MKEIMKYIIIVLILSIIGISLYNSYSEKKLNTIIKDNLYEYFKDSSKTNIGSEEFVLDDIRIKCRSKSAYIVEFNLLFSDDKSNLNNLGALVYKEDSVWKVNGTSSTFTKEQFNNYKFKCYNI
jgi:hypothetical protein